MARLRLYRNGRWVGTHVLDDQEGVVGRSERCVLVLLSPSSSRRHFSVQPNPRGEGFVLRDLDSENGTFVDGVREYTRPLRSRAIIQVGDEVVLFEPDGGPAPSPTASSESMPPWAQQALRDSPQMLQLLETGHATEHVAPAVQRRAHAERLAQLRPHVAVVERGGARLYPLDEANTSIGYGTTRVPLGPARKGNTVVLAEIRRGADDRYEIRSKGLFTKILVDGRSVARAELRSGTTLRVDGHLLRFELGLEK